MTFRTFRTFRTVATETSDILVDAVGRAIVTSLDRRDQKDARTANPISVAGTFIGSAKDHFDYSPDWWQLAFDEEYAADLLCKGTSVLQEVSVWRIYCDTDMLNTPMIDTFREVGYKQFGQAEKKPL